MSGDDARSNIVREWIGKAEHDLINAEHTLTLPDETCPFDTVCFHAQQCAEKYLKAALIHAEVEFPRTHDLTALSPLLPPAIRSRLSLENLSEINGYAVDVRYPGTLEQDNRDDAVAAVEIARSVRRAIRTFLSLDG